MSMPHTYVHFYFFAAKMKLLLPLVVWMLLTTTNVSRTLLVTELIYVFDVHRAVYHNIHVFL